MNFLAVDYRLHTPIHLHVEFEIRGFTALLGCSGAGKSSLLKALAGLLPATGTPWEKLPPEAREIGYLPQNAGLFPHLNVLENTAYPLRGAQRFARAQNLLDGLGLGELSAQPARALSGGQAQRIALARALARGVKLLLLDEPGAGLHARTRSTTLHWLVATLTARGIPTLAATHEPEVAMMADWLVLLAGGSIIQQGTPREVFARPGSISAAELLGFENIWVEAGQAYAIRAADIALGSAGRAACITSLHPHGAGVRLECAGPQTFVVELAVEDAAALVPGAKVFLEFPAQKLRCLGSRM